MCDDSVKIDRSSTTYREMNLSAMGMELFLIDAIGPFFRGYHRMRINWSKIPFQHLLDASPDDWDLIENELRDFARQVSAQGYNAVTLDDLAHLAPHPLHEPEVADQINFLRGKFTGFFDMLHGEFGLRVYLTTDVLPMTPALSKVMGDDPAELEAYYRSFIGWDCERFAQELSQVENLVGISVWCQTGGWHRLRRRAYLDADGRDIWIRLNTEAVITVFRDGRPADSAVENLLGAERAGAALELVDHADTVIRELLYIRDFARQKLFFRRVRIPPLLHVCWDSLFINHGVRKVMAHFVSDPENALSDGEAAAKGRVTIGGLSSWVSDW